MKSLESSGTGSRSAAPLALDELSLPTLRESVSETDWYVTLVQMVAGTVQDRRAASLDAPMPSAQGIGAPMIEL